VKLGIDFGTTRTVVAAAVGGRYPVAVFDFDGAFHEHVPGLAAAGVYGWEAAPAIGRGEPGLRSIKRVAASLAPDDAVPEVDVSALELVTGFLESLRESLARRSNLGIDPEEPLEAMVAVPAHASTRQRYLTWEAFRRAGFEVLGVINEPTAAAIEFAHRHLGGGVPPRSPKKYVVVYDLGGGTFDASAVSFADRRFELIATEGVAGLGGDDFDELVLEMTLGSLRLDPEALDPGRRSQVLELCREAKEGLGPNSRRLLVDLGSALPDVEPLVLDTAALYARSQPLVDVTLERTHALFEELGRRGIDPDDARALGAVYLVGGGAAFPAVARALRTTYGRKLKLAPQPGAATALGLAIAADPDAGVFVRESATRHFGVWREAEDGHDKVFDPIIEKHRAPPPGRELVVRRAYRPSHRVGHLRFMECSHLDGRGQPTGDLSPGGDVWFPYDPELLDAALETVDADRAPALLDAEILEIYTYAADGRISVVIENTTHGYRRVYELG
jgi:molecular chaperone DnaK (HSP70)